MPFDSIPQPAAPAPSFAIPVFAHSIGSWRVSVDRRPFAPGDLAARYDRKSADWQKVIDRHGFDAAYRSLIAKVTRQSRYRPQAADLRVLDVGVGTGALPIAFRRVHGRRFQLHGVDISEAMLQQARRRLDAQDIDVTLRRADLSALPYPDDAFDVVLAGHVIEHAPDPRLALAEIYRVLKPGGVLICSITRSSVVGAYIQAIWRTHRVSPLTARGWLAQCGLTSVRAVPYDKGAAARRFSVGYVGRKPDAGQVHPAAATG